MGLQRTIPRRAATYDTVDYMPLTRFGIDISLKFIGCTSGRLEIEISW